MTAGLATEVVAVADDHCGSHQDKKAKENQVHCFAAGATPFVKEDSPDGAENDN